MDKAKYILVNNIALLLSRNFLPVVKLHSLSHRPALELYNLFLPSVIISTVIRNVVSTKGFIQPKLFTALQKNRHRMNLEMKTVSQRF
jgi:hypothetical protein